MLYDIHTSITQLIYTHGRIDPNEVDICFEMPVREWVDSRIRPTINFYLFDLQENTELRQTHMQTTRGNGYATHRRPPRRFDLCYMVSALTNVPEDEYLLIWRVLATLLKFSPIPLDMLSTALQAFGLPLATSVSQNDEGTRLLDLWSALEVPPHPALYYVVTAPLDLEIVFESPLVLTRSIHYTRTVPTDEAAAFGIRPSTSITIATRTHIGGVIRTRQGIPVEHVAVGIEGRATEESITNEVGQFILRDVPHGSITLQVSRAGDLLKCVTMAVPASNYDITLD
jgi:hypothetical protein